MLTEGFKALALTLQEVSNAISHNDLRTQLHTAVKAKHPGQYPYLLDVFGDDQAGDVVYSMGDKYHRAPYTTTKSGNQAGSQASTKIGAHHEVTPRTTYHKVKVGEAVAEADEIDISGEFVALKEGAVAQDGQTLLKLIAPGWGSSGHYSEALLKRDGPKVFRAGTKNFWNHQTAAEESARPEGNLDDLASVLTENAYYDEAGPKGPGLYAKAKVYEHYRKAVDEMAKDIGVSIRAQGKAREGEVAGKKGMIIEQLTRGISADYVTTPGAGGQVVSLFEAARPRQSANTGEEETEMNEAEITKLLEAERAKTAALIADATKTLAAQNTVLRDRLALSEAGGRVDEILSAIDVLPGIKARVKARILGGVLPMTEAGQLDDAKLKPLVEAAAKEEAEYVSKLVEGSGGKVVGMGTTDPTKAADLTEADFEKEMVASYMREGKTEAEAKLLTRIGKAA